MSGNLPEVLSRAMQAMIAGFARSGPPEILRSTEAKTASRRASIADVDAAI
jgi:hypothetical protein